MKGFALGITAVVILAGCNPQVPESVSQATAAPATPAPVPTPTSKIPPLKITGRGGAGRPIRIVQQKENRREYVLLAHSYESQTTQGLAHATFHDAFVTFYDPVGRMLTAQAPQAVIDEATKTVMLVGGVTAHTSSGQGIARDVTLQCDTLAYNRATGLVHGEGRVRMANTSGMNLTGTRFDSDITLANIRMQ